MTTALTIPDIALEGIELTQLVGDLLAELGHEEFDDLAALAATIVHVPTAFITFAGSQRIWFKGTHNMPFREMAFRGSFSELVTRTRAPLIIPELRSDPRYAGHPLARLLNLRSLAGVPIFERGAVIGVLFVGDEHPRTFESATISSLERIARQIGTQLALHRARKELATSLEQETVLRAQEQRYRSLALALAGRQILWAADTTGRVTEWHGWIEVTGLDCADYHERWRRALHPDERAHVASAWSRSVMREELFDLKARLLTISGEYRWFHVRAAPVRDDAGVVREWIGLAADIHEQHEVEQELLSTEQRFAAFMTNTPAMAFLKDRESRYVWANRTFEQTFGIDLGALPGTCDYDWFEPSVAEQFIANDLAVLEKGEALTVVEDATAAGGIPRTWYTTKFPVLLACGELQLGCVSVDITERISLQRQLESAVRIDGLGRVAATIAHEVNNVLMGIQPFAEIISRRCGEDAHLAAAARHIRESVARGRRVTHEMLRFSHAADPVRKAFSLAAWMRDQETELKAVAGEDFELSIRAESDLEITADAGQLQQILLNLISNARDAMTGSGHIRIEVTPCAPGSIFAFGSVPEAERFAHMIIRDDGHGIAADVLPHIFEPLFTTKRGRGTGLGLAIAHQIVTAHGGFIFAESRQGEGSAFHLFLPRATCELAAPEACAEELPPSPDPASAPRTVLIVEDEPSIACGLTTLLELEGITTSWADSASAAVIALRNAIPDVILLDVGLPDRSGFDLYREITAKFGPVPTLFSSGHTELLPGPPPAGPVEYLLKPYEATDLLVRLSKLAAVH